MSSHAPPQQPELSPWDVFPDLLPELISALASLAWPIVAIVAIFLFRKQVSDLLGRLRTASPKGLGFDPPDQPPKKLDPEKDLQTSSVIEGEDIHPLAQKLGSRLRNELTVLQPEGQKEREELLLTRLSQALLRENFEHIYSIIFGSQLAALSELNNRGPTSIISFHNQHVASVAMAGAGEPVSYDNWLAYLQSQGLINMDEGIAKITEFGRTFIEYQLAAGRNLQTAW